MIKIQSHRHSIHSHVNFTDDPDMIDEELKGKIALWILRIIVNLKGINNLLFDDNTISHNTIARYIGIEQYIDKDPKDFTKLDIFKIVQENLSIGKSDHPKLITKSEQ